MSSVDWEHILWVEEGHTGEFQRLAKRATDPYARTALLIAAAREANHAEWVRTLRAVPRERGVASDESWRSDLQEMMESEDFETASYRDLAKQVSEPHLQLLLRVMASEEEANADMLRRLLGSRT